MNEFEVWHGLAYLYSSLSHWNDVEVCLKKAGELKQYSASMLHTEGKNKDPFNLSLKIPFLDLLNSV